jgi:hypothetical protein
MLNWLHKLQDRFRPSSSGPTKDKESRAAYYRFAVVMLIVLAIGPELVVLMDLAAVVSLYELLGGALLVTAYVSGVRLLAVELVRAVKNALRPFAPLLRLRYMLPSLERVRVLVYVSATTAWSLAFAAGF